LKSFLLRVGQNVQVIDDFFFFPMLKKYFIKTKLLKVDWWRKKNILSSIYSRSRNYSLQMNDIRMRLVLYPYFIPSPGREPTTNGFLYVWNLLQLQLKEFISMRQPLIIGSSANQKYNSNFNRIPMSSLF